MQKCSCVRPALDGLPSLSYSPHQCYFWPCICSSPRHADVSVCFSFRWAEHSEVHDARAPFTLSPSATFTQFHPSVHLDSFHSLILTSPYLTFPSLFTPFLFFNLTLQFRHLFLLINLLGWAHYTCLPFLSLCPVTAVLQGSACQLTKRTLRSMVITSPFHTLSTFSVISAARLFTIFDGIVSSQKHMSHTLTVVSF